MPFKAGDLIQIHDLGMTNKKLQWIKGIRAMNHGMGLLEAKRRSEKEGDLVLILSVGEKSFVGYFHTIGQRLHCGLGSPRAWRDPTINEDVAVTFSSIESYWSMVSEA